MNFVRIAVGSLKYSWRISWFEAGNDPNGRDDARGDDVIDDPLGDDVIGTDHDGNHDHHPKGDHPGWARDKPFDEKQYEESVNSCDYET